MDFDDGDVLRFADQLIPEVLRRAADDPMLFIDALVIPSAVGPMLFRDVMEPFQRQFFEELLPSLKAVAEWRIPPIRRFWMERTKKASKDADVAASLIWLMSFCKRPVKVQICAANRKQSGIIENRAVEILHYNPWLEDMVEIIDGCIRSKTMPRQVWTHIEATDSTGAAHGETPDVLVLNELVHVAKWRAMEDHMANAEGVPQGIAIIATNAGFKGTKAWEWRKSYINNPRWCKSLWQKPSPWLSKEDIQESKDRDPIGAEHARLFYGKWSSGTGNALSDEDIDSIFSMDGPLKKPEPGWKYILGLDLGIKHDHAGVAVVGVNRTLQIVRVVRVRGFAPSMEVNGRKEVDLQQVENYSLKMAKTFGVLGFYDKAEGGSFMAQRMRRCGVRMLEAAFSKPAFQTAMATSFVQLVKDCRLEAYEDKQGRLRRDFGKFNIEHKPPKNYKLVAVSDEYGHADVGVALIMTLPYAAELIGTIGAYSPTDVIASGHEDPLKDEEVDTMPAELREIYEMDDVDRY